MTSMTKQKIIENYFKALGWEYGPFTVEGSSLAGYRYDWKSTEGEGENSLPNITEYYPDFKKWVLEKMDEDGLKLSVSVCGALFKTQLISWDNDIGRCESESIEAKDNEILEAAVIAATRYFESKGEK